MRVTLIKDDNIVGFDREFRDVDLSGLDESIHAVQWNNSAGHIEYNGSAPNEVLTDFTAYQQYIDAWTAAAPPPPTLDELKAAKFEGFREETVVRMAAQVPAWDSFDRINFLMSIANMLNTASMTAEQALAKDILIYTRDTVKAKLTSIADEAALDTVDPTAADPFGDGTPWPT